MRRVEQKSDKMADCGVACVALVTNSSYKEAYECLHHLRNDDGEHYSRHKELSDAIQTLGYFVRQKRFNSFRAIEGVAIVAVNKRKDGCWHWVVVNHSDPNTSYIYDPKPGKKGKLTDYRGLKGFGNYLLIGQLPGYVFL